tara:strand:- start:1242 stop:1781 length:540 start_codon:yes stop_codon:yes gene_type:complete
MKVFKNELKSALSGVTKDKTRYTMDGIRIEEDKIVSTDGRILVLLDRLYPHYEDFEFEPFIIPFKTVKELVRSRGNYEISFKKMCTTIEARYNDMTLEFIPLEGSFPPYKDVIPTKEEFIIGLGVELLTKLLKSAKEYKIETIRFGFTTNKEAVLLTGEDGDEFCKNWSSVIMPVNLKN